MSEINKKAIEKELTEQVRKYILVKKDIEQFNNRYISFIEGLESEILRMMNVLGIEEFDGVKKELQYKDKTLSIAELKEKFNDHEMIDHIVVTVSLPLTAENLRIKNGFNSDIVHGYIQLLNKDVRVVTEGLTLKR